VVQPRWICGGRCTGPPASDSRPTKAEGSGCGWLCCHRRGRGCRHGHAAAAGDAQRRWPTAARLPWVAAAAAAVAVGGVARVRRSPSTRPGDTPRPQPPRRTAAAPRSVGGQWGARPRRRHCRCRRRTKRRSAAARRRPPVWQTQANALRQGDGVNRPRRGAVSPFTPGARRRQSRWGSRRPACITARARATVTVRWGGRGNPVEPDGGGGGW